MTYGYLTTGEVKTVSDGATTLATYSYDPLGNRLSVAYGNGTGQTSTYDPVSRLKSLSITGLPAANNLTIDTINYDPAGRITSAKRYDAAGADTYAWSNYSAVTRAHSINNLNQVTQTVSSPGATVTFGYDSKGNLTSDGTNSFTYDAENHLTAMGTKTLSYDPFGRLMQLNAAATTKFAYDGLQMIAEYNGSSLTSRYVFGPGMDEPIVAYDPSGNRSWLYADERGSVVAAADASAGVLFANRYDEYGAPPLDAGGANLNSGRFQYTGQMWLGEIGLYYYKARLYSPTLGRFMQTDPIGYADNANLYAYVGNDPINFVDPLGLSGGCTPRVTGGGLTIIACRPQNPHEYPDPSTPGVSPPKERRDGIGRGNKKKAQEKQSTFSCAASALWANKGVLALDALSIGASFVPGGRGLLTAGASVVGSYTGVAAFGLGIADQKVYGAAIGASGHYVSVATGLFDGAKGLAANLPVAGQAIAIGGAALDVYDTLSESGCFGEGK